MAPPSNLKFPVSMGYIFIVKKFLHEIGYKNNDFKMVANLFCLFYDFVNKFRAFPARSKNLAG
jgi:hypothetical protein